MKNLLNVLILLTLMGCQTTGVESGMAEVSGEAVYFERIAAPPDARLEVVLEDISRPGMSAERLGEMIVEQAGQPPYEFRIEYDPAQIDPRHTYRVAARLYDGDELLFVTDTVHQVITRGFPNTVDVRMRRVERPRRHPLGDFPAQFAGTLPCADCPGIDFRLDLLADGVYLLRQTYQDRDGGPFYDVGRYLVTSRRDRIALHGGREAPMRFAISDSDTLRMLNRDGGRIESELDYSLSRQPELPLLEPRLLLRGEYRYLAGAGRFRECLTGLDMPVAAEADNRALEAAYLEARDTPGEPLLVSLEGQIAQRQPMEGPGPVPTLVPERFIGISPDLDCPSPVSAATLENTYWRLIQLNSSAIERFPNQREPHLILRESGELAGSDGCNRLIGRFEASGRSIGFSGLAATRMMCAEGMDQAQAFRDTLELASHFRIVGNQMEVLDEDENLLMRFEAVAFD
ncbi:MAG: YbaY family lipoprotein [Wenzhouxiangellaceae bacterium]|nr:YbaY family lipoprotein [Wenzhouxiangellaceae bacterium]MBS3823739.1 YbaY family lipoprotein [Wenzhouxiangellaceae bacterium]